MARIDPEVYQMIGAMALDCELRYLSISFVSFYLNASGCSSPAHVIIYVVYMIGNVGLCPGIPPNTTWVGS